MFSFFDISSLYPLLSRLTAREHRQQMILVQITKADDVDSHGPTPFVQCPSLLWAIIAAGFAPADSLEYESTLHITAIIREAPLVHLKELKRNLIQYLGPRPIAVDFVILQGHKVSFHSLLATEKLTCILRFKVVAINVNCGNKVMHGVKCSGMSAWYGCAAPDMSENKHN